MLAADLVWPLRDAPSGAFALEDANAAPEQAVVTAVDRPVLLGYAPDKPNGRAMLVLGGGGYVALISFMVLMAIGITAVPVALLLVLIVAMAVTALYGWTVERIAAAFATSASTLQRRLAQEGETVSQCLRDVRLETALVLLQSSTLQVSEIAARCGYESHSRFSAAFRERFGFPPSQLRP